MQEILIDGVLFASISLLCQSLFRTSMMLLMPWGKEDEDGPTINLPAEYFLLLPLLAHRRLFGDFERQVAMPLASCVSRPMCEWWSTHPGAPNHRKTGDGLHTITSHRVRLRVAGGQASRVDIPARPRAGRRPPGLGLHGDGLMEDDADPPLHFPAARASFEFLGCGDGHDDETRAARSCRTWRARGRIPFDAVKLSFEVTRGSVGALPFGWVLRAPTVTICALAVRVEWHRSRRKRTVEI